MTEYFTTREIAALLRVKERKIYDLVAQSALPMRRVTGKLLFPKSEIEAWIAASAAQLPPGQPRVAVSGELPLVMTGGHDLLLDWALRESRCGVAALLDGALDGLARFRAQTCLAAGLHIPSDDFADWNVDAVRETLGREPVVLIEWAKRTRGLMYRRDTKVAVDSLAAVGRMRFQTRQPEAGSELVLDQLLKQQGMARADLNAVEAVERSEADLAMAIAAGRADIGLGIEAAARQFQLDFAPLVVERFDLLVWRKNYFDPPFQQFIGFCGSDAFRKRAEVLGGYDCSAMGAVRFNGP